MLGNWGLDLFASPLGITFGLILGVNIGNPIGSNDPFITFTVFMLVTPLGLRFATK